MNLIECRDVTFVREGKTLLDRVNWTIRPGENWVLFGANGSGKTLLLQLIEGYIFPTSGSIVRFGKSDGLDLREMRKRTGYIGRFIHSSVRGYDHGLDIVLSGKFASIGIYDEVSEEDERKARNLLQLVQAEHLLDREYGTLSNGERERVLIARSLMSDPEILILDEPCAGLDIPAREHFLRMLSEVDARHPRMAIVLVTHYPEEITSLFTQTLILNGGKVLALGEVEKVFTSETVGQALEVNVEIRREYGRYWCLIR